MNKLILALALVLTPFFSQVSLAYYEPESVSPKVEVKTFGRCMLWEGSIDDVSEEECVGFFTTSLTAPYEDATASFEVISRGDFGVMWSIKISWPTENGTGTYTHVNKNYIVTTELQSKSCAPDDYPLYIYPKDSDGDGEIDQCFKDNPALDKCSQGHYKYAVGGECVPVQCEDAGTQDSIWASGSVYSNTSGTYCDGSCAHTVSGGQNDAGYSGNIAISAVSTGDICGQGTDTWHNEGAGENCQSVSLDSGGSFVSCPNGDTEEAEHSTEPTVNLEPEKVSDEEIPTLTPIEETCATGDPSCEIRNLKETIISKGLEQKEIDLILHNKQLDAQTKTSTKLIDSVTQSTDRNAQGLQMITAAIDNLATNGISSGGGGGGGDSEDGFCDEEGNCSTAIETKTEPSEGLIGFWESEYENGLQGIMDEKLIDVKGTEFFGFIDQFNPSIGGGAAPSYNMCFNIGGLVNLGCHNFDIDPRTFPAIKIFILVSAGFLCRRILFGG